MALLAPCPWVGGEGGQGLGVWACPSPSYQAESSTVNPQQTMVEYVNVPEKEVLHEVRSLPHQGSVCEEGTGLDGWLDWGEGRRKEFQEGGVETFRRSVFLLFGGTGKE